MEQLSAARAELREAILEAARDRRMTTYTDVAAFLYGIEQSEEGEAGGM
jgi:hypothetical protein